MKYVLHGGSNNYLAVAEVISLLGENSVLSVYGDYVLVETDLSLDQSFLNKLGGTIAIYIVEDEVADFFWEDALDLIKGSKFDSKISFGIASNNLTKEDTESFLKNIKKGLKNLNISSRFALNVSAASLKSFGELNTQAFVFGWFKFSDRKYLTRLVAIQDIDAYSLRDFSKPFRSAKLGMLPPKLAQIMLNLANCKSVYDPFCGTGTVLLEAMLVDSKAKGSDINPVNTDGTKTNVKWLADRFNLKVDLADYPVYPLDATEITSKDLEGVDAIVTEGFLGVPKQGNESDQSLEAEIVELGKLYFDFLKAVAKAKQFPTLIVVLTLPVYKGSKQNYFIENLVEKLPALGYSVSALVPNNNFGLKPKDNVLYKRNDQKVFRQVIRLELKS